LFYLLFFAKISKKNIIKSLKQEIYQMKQSKLAIKTKREFSSKAHTESHKWLERAGFISQHTAGIHHYGHFFVKTMTNLENLITKHLEETGATQVQLPFLQSAELWKKSGRWDAFNNERNSGAMFTSLGRDNHLYTLAASAEEVATEYIKNCQFTAKNFGETGTTIFQHGNKLRDELRAAGGVVRGKEFKMMDAYSFSSTESGMQKTYAEIKESLTKLLDYLDLDYAFVSADNGDMGGSLSEELMIFSNIGTDIVWTDESGQSANEEVADSITWVGEVKKRKALEVGHIFQLGTKYSEAFDLKWDSAEGQRLVHMASYGIGTSRLLSAYVEKNHDSFGMKWMSKLSAYNVHIIQIGDSEEVSNMVNKVESKLNHLHKTYLTDDRAKIKAGAKFMEADMIGLTYQIVIGKNNAINGIIDIKNRLTNEKNTIELDNLSILDLLN
jgi:prolyl-tRNA synthetase